MPESDGDVHVMPEADLIEHAFLDCVCGPRMELRQSEDEGDSWLVVHHSLDGRELTET